MLSPDIQKPPSFDKAIQWQAPVSFLRFPLHMNVTIEPSPMFPKRMDVSIPLRRHDGPTYQARQDNTPTPSLWGLLPMGAAATLGAYGVEEVVRSNFIKDKGKASRTRYRGLGSLSVAALACGLSSPSISEVTPTPAITEQTPFTETTVATVMSAWAGKSIDGKEIQGNFDPKYISASMLEDGKTVGNAAWVKSTEFSGYFLVWQRGNATGAYYMQKDLASADPAHQDEVVVPLQSPDGKDAGDFYIKLATTTPSKELGTLVTIQQLPGDAIKMQHAFKLQLSPDGVQVDAGFFQDLTVSSKTTAVPSATATIEATATAEVTPTATPVPTEAGPKAGDTKVENGIVYTYKEIGEFKIWVRPLAVDVPMWDRGGMYSPTLNPDGKSVVTNGDGSVAWQNAKNIGPINVFVEDFPGNQDIKAITHTSHDKFFQSTYDATIIQKLLEIFTNTPNFHSKLSKEQTNIFNATLQGPGMPVKFTDGDKPYEWSVGSSSGATIYVVDYDKMAPTKENGFWEWITPGSTHKFRVGYLGVDGHGLIGVISSEQPLSELTDAEIRMLPLWHIAVALDNKDVRNSGFGIFLQMLLQYTNTPQYPQLNVQK